jgi:hypothetical protein
MLRNDKFRAKKTAGTIYGFTDLGYRFANGEWRVESGEWRISWRASYIFTFSHLQFFFAELKILSTFAPDLSYLKHN